jgi:putative NADH-flavin reductase
MKLLVLGASGQVGRLVVDRAVARGHRVTAVVRPASPFDRPVEVVRDEVLRPGALAAVVPGHEAVISCLGIQRRSLNPFSALTSPADLGEATAHALVAAMRSAGVPKVVAISAAGVGDSAPRMNALMRWAVARTNVGVAYRDLERMEQVLAASGLDWCCVRPVTLTNGPHTGKVREVDAFGLTATISRADVAHDLLDRVERPITVRRPQIAGA